MVNRTLDGEEFVIEKLFRGSIINHNSFLMEDMIDTDFICRTTVSYFMLTTEQVEKLRSKYEACEKILHQYESKTAK